MVKKYMEDDERPSFLSEKVRGIIDLVRPFTLLPALMAGIFISMMPILLNGENPLAYWDTMIYIGVTLALLQGAGQVINQSHPEEVKIDKMNEKDYRPIPKGILSKEEGWGIGMILLMIGISRAFTVTVGFGLYAMLISFFSVFYTVPPIRAKKRYLVNVFWLGVSRGFLPVVACFSVFDGLTSSIPLVWGALGFIWVAGFNPVKDIPDMWGDRAFDIPSIPVKWGHIGTAVHTFSFASVFTAILHYSLGEFLTPVFMSLYLLVPVAFFIPTTMFLHGSRQIKVPYLENNLTWVLFYLGLGFLFLLPPLTAMVI